LPYPGRKEAEHGPTYLSLNPNTARLQASLENKALTILKEAPGMRRFCDRLSWVAFFACIFALSPAAQSESIKAKADEKAPQDEIEVVGYVPLTGGPVRRLLPTEHYSSYYLYAERDAGKGVTLIDVTKATQPFVSAEIAYPSKLGLTGLLTVAGTAALITDGQEAATAVRQQTIRIIDFSESRNPKVVREFTGVTATSLDGRRGLIFVANTEGVWILHQNLAEDPEIGMAYAHRLLYDR
jgi:hypothetical protein